MVLWLIDRGFFVWNFRRLRFSIANVHVINVKVSGVFSSCKIFYVVSVGIAIENEDKLSTERLIVRLGRGCPVLLKALSFRTKWLSALRLGSSSIPVVVAAGGPRSTVTWLF